MSIWAAKKSVLIGSGRRDGLMTDSGDGQSPSLGQNLAGYELLGVLGRGGMGSVFLARHPRLPRNVALKVLHPALSKDPQYRARFEREADLAAGLDHPNIVTVHDRGLDDGRLWISMQYAGQTNAADVLAAEGPMDPARAVHIVAKVGAALDHAHRFRLWHRDVKPANIMLLPDNDPDEPERVLLTDFGIAKAEEASVQLTQTGSFLATFAYAAPEQIEGAAIDHRVDIYALGAVLFELLTGHQPFSSTSPYALMVAHLETPPPDPRELRHDLPEGFAEVIAAAMAKDREQRPATGRALARAASSALLSTVTTAATPPARTDSAPIHPAAQPHWSMTPPGPSEVLGPNPADPADALSHTPAEPTNVFSQTPAEPVDALRHTPAEPTNVEPHTPAGATNVVSPVGDVAPERVISAGPAGFAPVYSDRIAERPTSEPPKPGQPGPAGARPRGRRRRLIAAALVGLLVAAGAGVWFFLLRAVELTVPQGITAASESVGVTLTWEEVSGADRYEVIRGDSLTVTTTEPQYLDRSGDSGESYEYRVRALGPGGAASTASEPVQVYAPLRAPENLAASSTGADVALSWAEVPNATSYEIERDGTVVGETDTLEFLDTTSPSGELRYAVTGVSDNSEIAAAPAVTMHDHASWEGLQSLATAFEGIVSNRPGGVSDYGATCTPGTGTAGTLHYDQYIVCAYPNGIRLDVLHYPDEAALAAAYAQLLPASRVETTWKYNNSDVAEGPLLRSREGAPAAWRWVGYYNIPDRVQSALYVEWPGHSDQELYDVWWLPTRIG